MKKNNRYTRSAKHKKKEAMINKHISFVVIAYVLLACYLLFIIINSLLKVNVNYVYAEEGSIHEEGEFKGVLLRNETVFYSDDTGPVRYYVPEGSKVRLDAYVCAVNQDSEMEALLQSQINDHLTQLQNAVDIQRDDYSRIQNKIRDYELDKEKYDMSYIYEARDTIESTLYEISQTVNVVDASLYERIQESIAANEAQMLTNGSYYKVQKSGVISYTFDGFEAYNFENYTLDILHQSLKSTDLIQKQSVQQGEPLYKIVDNYLYYIVSEIDAYAAKHLQDRKYVTLYFPEKNQSIDVRKVEVRKVDNKYYATYEVDRYFDLFFNDRFIDYKMSYSDYGGIKIPNSAVTTKSLYEVPESAIQEVKGNMIIQKVVYSNQDVTHEEIIPVQIKVYYIDGDTAYIRSMDEANPLASTDNIQYVEDPTAAVSAKETTVLGQPIDVEGVYVLNKGYTDFKRIETIYEAESFRIIKDNERYSVGLYDKIATDASNTQEFTTLGN